jgi:hypothetical protein
MAVPATHPPPTRLARHADFLAQLHLVFAAFNAIVGAGVVAFAVSAALLRGPAGHTRPGADIAASVTAGGFAVVAGAALVWAVVHWWCGRALLARDHRGRLLGLTLATLNAVLFPIGTLLAAYALWVLLQDDARRLFESTPSAPSGVRPRG